jgi:glyoxylase-like metal-dependent hydrolase (beta-lactamase superfamily II)
MNETWTTAKGSVVTKIVGGRSNVFLLTCGSRRMLIDTGARSSRKTLDGALRAGKSGSLDLLVLTHAHFDHAENARYVRDTFGVFVVAGFAELPGLTAGWTTMPRGTNPFVRVVSALGGLFADRIRYESCAVNLTVEAPLDLGSFGFPVSLLPTPGHTAGSVSVIVDDEIALAGDALFGIFPGSAFPPFADDPARLVESWGALLDTGCRVFLPSHGHAVSREVLARDYECRRAR